MYGLTAGAAAALHGGLDGGVIFAVFGGGTLHELAGDLGIIARAAEADAARDLGDGEVAAAQEREALLDAVVQQEIERRLVHGGLEQTTEFALARMTGRGHLVERDGLAAMFIDEGERLFHALDELALALRGGGGGLRGVLLVDQRPDRVEDALDGELITDLAAGIMLLELRDQALQRLMRVIFTGEDEGGEGLGIEDRRDVFFVDDAVVIAGDEDGAEVEHDKDIIDRPSGRMVQAAAARPEGRCPAEQLGGELKFRSTEIAPKNDRDISILEMLPEICADQDVFCKDVMLATLRANGGHMHPGCRVEGIEAEGVRAYDMAAEKEIFLAADTVILADGLRSNAEDAFQDAAYPVIRVGDAIRAGKIHAAIYTAYCAARSL